MRYLVVAYGTVARTCKTVLRERRAASVRVGLFRPINLWPFPYARLRELSHGKRAISSPK